MRFFSLLLCRTIFSLCRLIRLVRIFPVYLFLFSFIFLVWLLFFFPYYSIFHCVSVYTVNTHTQKICVVLVYYTDSQFVAISCECNNNNIFESIILLVATFRERFKSPHSSLPAYLFLIHPAVSFSIPYFLSFF